MITQLNVYITVNEHLSDEITWAEHVQNTTKMYVGNSSIKSDKNVKCQTVNGKLIHVNVLNSFTFVANDLFNENGSMKFR